MQTHTIERPQWKQTFDSLTRVYDGSTASLEILSPERGAQFEVEEQPLRGITYDASGIELHFATRDGQRIVHRISHPKQVQFEEGDDGLVQAVEIESDDDPRAVLRLHAPLASHLLGRGEA